MSQVSALQIVILDDEPKMGKILARVLGREGHEVQSFTDPHAALAAIEASHVDMLLTDLKMPEMDGLTVLNQVRERSPGTDVVMMTAYATAETAVQAMKQGAFDYLIKPFPNEELVMLVARVAERRGLREENRMLKETIQREFKPENVVAASPAMLDVLKRVHKVAQSNVTVLLRGESGCGKEVLANAIHASGTRSQAPLVKVNCGALPENLLESELFGHVKGAFTGAVETRKGLFEQANGGTIFLDEIGEVTPALQVKLLRVLQSGEFQRVGDARSIKVDVRVLAATNRDLEAMIECGDFRSDLYYRLNVVPITIPPLRERNEDIPALIDFFMKRLRERDDRAVKVETDALNAMLSYRWPGNIRELENALEHAWVMCENDTITIDDMPVALQGHANIESDDAGGAYDADVPESSGKLEDLERQALVQALEQTRFNQTRAAEKLGITRRTLGYRMQKYGIENPRRREVREEQGS